MWEQIRSNKIRSVVLVIGMGLLLLAIGYAIGLYIDSPVAGLIIALIVWGIMSLVAYFEGDSILLAVSKARKIGPDDYPRLYNVVEEMRIASGLPKMPGVYIIDDPALNAFATGRSPERASVAVTSGLLQKLNRDELQGVIAHEIGHIKNRDILLMSVAGVLLGTIVILSWYASRTMLLGGMGGSRRRDDKGGGQIIILIIGLVLMILAPIAAQLLYFAISRRREYLADASSALYTRYPEGLASALEKLMVNSPNVKTANNATAPMYIVNPFRKSNAAPTDWTSTHPPLQERIKILRAMGGGASYGDYNKAFTQVHKGGGAMVPASALAAVSAVPLRQASANQEPEPDKLERTRETSNLMQKMDNYKMIDCECGTRLKVPPGFEGSRLQCPHCGRIHDV